MSVWTLNRPMKVVYCVDCAFYTHKGFFKSKVHLCKHPKNLIPGDLITGKGEKMIYPSCEKCRESDTACGKLGNWFSRKTNYY